ncbi:putative disease resistance protein [Hibiscus syriacus]|uniref:Protein FAR1-RELATED SEQUENCE n=1 Tax=Hibiscus syriacus TaxID=106335 RepID=A0A6A2YNC5_HIBSY|nr:putative disease resistance protein [Hibiscus syriacus]
MDVEEEKEVPPGNDCLAEGKCDAQSLKETNSDPTESFEVQNGLPDGKKELLLQLSESFKRNKDVNRRCEETKTGCPAMIRMRVVDSIRWRVLEVMHEHNHLLGAKIYKSVKKMGSGAKSKLQSSSDAEVRSVNLYRPLVIDAAGNRKPNSNAVAHTNRSFFYLMNFNDKGHLRNVSGLIRDVGRLVAISGMSFILTTLSCEIDMRQTVLLGCGLLFGETSESYTWIFKAWLTCVSAQCPQTIITDSCKALQNAIAELFPKSNHHFSLSCNEKSS